MDLSDILLFFLVIIVLIITGVVLARGYRKESFTGGKRCRNKKVGGGGGAPNPVKIDKAMIRFATISDLPYIKALAEQYQQLVYGKITDRTLDEINNIALVNGVTYVYDTPQGVLGFLTVEPNRAPPDVIIRLIVVHHEHQNKGIGQLLLQQALRDYQDKGCILTIEKQHPMLDVLIKYYSKYGFQITSSTDSQVNLRLDPF